MKTQIISNDQHVINYVKRVAHLNKLTKFVKADTVYTDNKFSVKIADDVCFVSIFNLFHLTVGEIAEKNGILKSWNLGRFSQLSYKKG